VLIPRRFNRIRLHGSDFATLQKDQSWSAKSLFGSDMNREHDDGMDSAKDANTQGGIDPQLAAAMSASWTFVASLLPTSLLAFQ
jgi:hypothetical protein